MKTSCSCCFLSPKNKALSFNNKKNTSTCKHIASMFQVEVPLCLCYLACREYHFLIRF